MKKVLQKIRSHRKKILIIIPFLVVLFLYMWTTPHFEKQGTIKIWDRNNILLYELSSGYGKRQTVPYERIPSHVIQAVVASEDESFWTNQGIDSGAILRSLWINITNREIVTGASTITQQLARTAMSTSQLPSDRSFVRKIREVLMAVRINQQISKKQILEHYFNTMYFGSLSYGIQSASLTYFDKDVSQLSLAEGALLVGLLSSPEARNPYSNFEGAKKRQEYVLSLMRKNSMISQDQYTRAKTETIDLSSAQMPIKAPHFVNYVLEEVQQMDMSDKRGLNVYTTLDYPLQQVATEIASRWVERLSDQHNMSNASIVMLENKSRAMRVMMGGIDYFDATHSGQVNIATALRQPGSTLKPITYAVAFSQGDTPASVIYDVKKVYKTKKGEGFTPHNYDGKWNGIVLAREALASSLNLPAVEMLNRVGLDAFITASKDLGITTFTQSDRYDLSITLGGGEVTLLDLTNVYASFARGGASNVPYAIEQIATDNGKQLYNHTHQDDRPVFGEESSQIAYLITDILSDPKARMMGFGEKNPLVLSRPAVAKTGTTTDWHDNWTVGYTPEYSVGVWVGNNDNQPMRDITGIVGAAPIWNEFFEEALKGTPVTDFAVPEGIQQIEVCADSGMLPDGLCPTRKFEVFMKEHSPQKKSTMHQEVLIDNRNGFIASESCDPLYTVKKTFIKYPPQVFTWAVENGKEVIPQEYSPLCESEKNGLSGFIEITYPRNKAVFETAPELVSYEAVVFTANTSPSISSVSWILDDKTLSSDSHPPFSYSWKPRVGNHTLHAEARLLDGKVIQSESVSFQVVEYKENF